ncbi:MAG: BON domain-containing protein [Succinivibrionaceae bacterium]|nr:BON domain-containing protein [Succinivibrionaceae bacterium]
MRNTSTYLRATLLAATLASALSLAGCAAALVGAAAAGTTGAVIGSDSRTIDKIAYDDVIERNAIDILKSNADIYNGSNFSVTVVSMSGKLVAYGQTTESAYLESCLEKMRKLDYVRAVHDYVERRGRLSVGEISTDAYITSKIKGLLLFSEKINSGRFKICTDDARVFMLGFVNRDEAARAVNQVLTIDGVKKVYTLFDYMDVEPVMEQRSQQPAAQVISGATGAPSATAAPASYRASGSNVDNGGAAIVDDGGLLAPAASY